MRNEGIIEEGRREGGGDRRASYPEETSSQGRLGGRTRRTGKSQADEDGVHCMVRSHFHFPRNALTMVGGQGGPTRRIRHPGRTRFGRG